MPTGIGRSVLSVTLVIAACYIALVAVLYVTQRSLLFPGAVHGTGEPPARPAWGETVLIETPDGETLHALHSRPRDGRPTVLFFHGNADGIDHYRFLADALARHGIGLLASSYRGYGGSTGRPSEQGLLADGCAAHDWLSADGQDRIVVVGQSLGSAVAVHVAVERPTRGVVFISGFSSALELARSFYPFVPVAHLIRDPFRSDLWIGDATLPKLFIHGDRDEVVPIRFGRDLFDRAPPPKSFRVHAGSGHNDLWSDVLLEEILIFVEDVAKG